MMKEGKRNKVNELPQESDAIIDAVYYSKGNVWLINT